jgi:hypothetical protein
MHIEKCGFARPDPRASLFSADNKQFYVYFVMPLLLGIVLGDWLGIDISRMAAQHIGLLRFIQSAGIDIRTKSMILIIYLVFAPCYCYSLFKHRKSPYPLKAKTVTDLVSLIIVALIMGLGTYGITIIGLHENALVTPSRPIRLLLACSRWNLSFAIYVGFLVWFLFMTIFFQFILINELLQRLKNRINHIGRSK